MMIMNSSQRQKVCLEQIWKLAWTMHGRGLGSCFERASFSLFRLRPFFLSFPSFPFILMNNLGCRIVVSLGARRFASISSPKAAAKPFFTRKALYATALTGCAGGLGYYLLQDTVYLEEAHGAHEHVPPLALHPQTGGPKNLPIVTHQLDEEKGEEQKPRLVILGGGWGAVSMLQHLDRGKYNVTVISDNNYFLFTPLLPSVTVGTNEARYVVEKWAVRVYVLKCIRKTKVTLGTDPQDRCTCPWPFSGSKGG